MPLKSHSSDWYTYRVMNKENAVLLSVPMVKETIIKEDGRHLFYYTFPEETPEATQEVKAQSSTEAEHV